MTQDNMGVAIVVGLLALMCLQWSLQVTTRRRQVHRFLAATGFDEVPSERVFADAVVLGAGSVESATRIPRSVYRGRSALGDTVVFRPACEQGHGCAIVGFRVSTVLPDFAMCVTGAGERRLNDALVVPECTQPRRSDDTRVRALLTTEFVNAMLADGRWREIRKCGGWLFVHRSDNHHSDAPNQYPELIRAAGELVRKLDLNPRAAARADAVNHAARATVAA